MLPGSPVRNPGAVVFARHYGLTIATCLPADPQTKGGSEASVRIAKAGLVPAAANLLAEYSSFAALEAACAAFCSQVNGRPHRATRRVPAGMLAEERSRLHLVPAAAFTAVLGVTRKVDGLSMIWFEGSRYSVPHQFAGQAVWARRHGDDIVIVHAGEGGPAEVARHQVNQPGQPQRPGRAFVYCYVLGPPQHWRLLTGWLLSLHIRGADYVSEQRTRLLQL
jgi:hypothetical protein